MNKSHMIKFFILAIAFTNLIMNANAYVSYNENSNQITVHRDPGHNMTWLYNQVNNDSLLRHEDKVWYLNSTLSFDSSVFYINDSDVKQLFLSNEVNGIAKGEGGLRAGDVRINDITIKSWNWTNNREPDTFLNEKQFQVVCDDSGYIYNTTFDHIHKVSLNRVSNINITNTIMNNSFGGIALGSCTNINMIDSRVTNVKSGRGINVGNCKNIHVKNAYVDVADGGVVFRTCSNSSMENIFTNNTGWMGVEADNGANNITFKNVTVRNAYHNGLDLHGAYNVYVENMSIYDSISNNALITGSGNYENGGSWNITLKDIYTYKSGPQGGTGIAIASQVRDVTLINVTTETENNGIELNDINGLKVLNFTAINCNYCIFAQNMKNTIVLDSNLFDSKKTSIYHHNNGINYVNVHYKDIALKDSANLTLYYYSDILVEDTNGKSISNSKVWFENKTKPSFPSVIEVTDKPVLASFYKTSSGYIENADYIAKITTPDGRTVSLSGITPDSSWYRKNPNVPTYTITAIIPDDSKGPHITGFAPAENNPLNPGEKKNFRVWTDEPLTTMEWYVDGSDLPVSKGSLNYAWPVTEGKHTIKFVGSNANGNVNYTWDLGGSSDEPSVPGDDDPTQEIKFSPADAVLTRNVSEKTVFSVSPDIFTTKEWYINGDQVLNNTASMTRCWDAAGTYKVTFSGSGSGGTVSNTWAVNVFEEPKEEEQNRSEIMIAPEYQIITPKQSFSLNIIADPSTPITGAQLDFILDSSMVSANGATEGNLFKQNGAQTLFSGGTIDKSAGKIKNIYGFVIGTSNISSPGTMATVNLTAGNRTGIAEFSLSNVIISNTSSKPVPITIKNATVLIDTAPVMNQICCPKSVNEKSTLTFKVSARDADGDRLILSASGLPQGAVFNTTSGTFTWTPERGQAGTYIFTFKVSDGYLTDSENVTVTVNKLNNLPVINFFEPLNGAFFSEGEKINISVNASDADRQALNYSIRIDGVEYSTGPAYVWETDYSSSGNRTIEVAVSDGIDEVKEQHTIFINNYHPRWDVNEDGIVNILDITIIAQKYGSETKKPYPRWDVNQDGVINIQDLTLAGYYFGEIVI